MATEMAATIMANTAAIMSTRQGPPSRATMLALAATAFAAGLVLIAIAVPRIAGHAALLPAAAATRAIDEGTPLSLAEVEQAYKAYGVALSWLPGDPAIRRDRARLSRRIAAMAEHAEGAPDKALAGRQAEALDDLRLAAAASPGDGFTWALLADAELQGGAGLEEVAPYLRLAHLTAPRRASAVLIRFGIVMRHWRDADDGMRAAAMEDLPVLWSRGHVRARLVRDYVSAGFEARAAFRDKLAENPVALRVFDRLLAAQLAL